MATKKANQTTADWEEIQPFTTPITLEAGEDVIAFYLGGNTVDVPADDDDVQAVEKDGRKVRPTLMHEFQEDADSEPFGIWGSAVLDKRLADVPANTRVKILYEGKQELDGGRTARRYRVWVDKSAQF